jgi:hypothetical protein
VFVEGALFLFMLIVFVEEVMSCLRYLCRKHDMSSSTNTNNVNKTRAPLPKKIT